MSSNTHPDLTQAAQTQCTTITNGVNEVASKVKSSKIVGRIDQLKSKGERIIREHIPSTESLGNYIESIHNSLNTNPLEPSMNYWLVGYRACEKLAMPLVLLWDACPTPMVKVIVSASIGSILWLPALIFFWIALVPTIVFLILAYLVLFGFQTLQLHLEETFSIATGLTFKEGVKTVEGSSKYALEFVSNSIDQVTFVDPRVIKGQLYDLSSACIAIVLSALSSLEQFVRYLDSALKANCQPVICTKSN